MLEKNKIENEEQLISSLKDVVKAIKTQENPDELNKYRYIFKKAVPLTMRSYVAAYLIKNVGVSGISRQVGKRTQRDKNTNDSFRASMSSRPSRPKIILPEDVATSLFLGIGRKRGVYPKDIISLLMQGAGVEREHIGDIRILDNYCFVQVMQDEADDIINKLNNSYYRGKNLTVSHSRRPDEETSNENTLSDTDNNLIKENNSFDRKNEYEGSENEIMTENSNEANFSKN